MSARIAAFIGVMFAMGACALPSSVAATSMGGDTGHDLERADIVFPEEVRGAWDVAPFPCKAGEETDSDARLVIDTHTAHQGEDRARLVTIRQVVESPKTWHVTVRSSLGDGELPLSSEIYVAGGNRLIVTDGQNEMAYVRCT